MSGNKYAIFICYRRNGGYETAKHIYDLLSRDGYSVSFDIDTLRSGDFDKQLYSRIDSCVDFILILDKNAFDRTVDNTYDPALDWMRKELSYALKLHKNIIPVFLPGFSSFPENLPEDIAAIKGKNGPKYDEYYFNEFYDKLKKRFLQSRKRSLNSALKLSVVCIILLFAIVCCLFYYPAFIPSVFTAESLSPQNVLDSSDAALHPKCQEIPSLKGRESEETMMKSSSPGDAAVDIEDIRENAAETVVQPIPDQRKHPKKYILTK